jgi:hypothetical protein
MPTRVVNIFAESFDVYVGRRGKGQDGYFGNYVSTKADGPAGLDEYRKWFLAEVERNPTFRRRVLELRGKTLGCFCKPAPKARAGLPLEEDRRRWPCHGDVLATWLDAQPGGGS